MEIKRLRTLAREIFKTVNNLNPDFMKSIFYLSPYQTHKKYDIFVHSRNTASFGDKSSWKPSNSWNTRMEFLA